MLASALFTWPRFWLRKMTSAFPSNSGGTSMTSGRPPGEPPTGFWVSALTALFPSADPGAVPLGDFILRNWRTASPTPTPSVPRLVVAPVM
jgi:hypothetical protein